MYYSQGKFAGFPQVIEGLIFKIVLTLPNAMFIFALDFAFETFLKYVRFNERFKKLKAMKSILRVPVGQVRNLFGINREMLKKYLSEILFFENTTQKGKIWR